EEGVASHPRPCRERLFSTPPVTAVGLIGYGTQYICSGRIPPGPIKSPQVSSACTSTSSLCAGLFATLSEYLYLPGGSSSLGPSGDFAPAPAATLIVCLLMVTTASPGIMLPNSSLAWPAFGRMPAFSASAGLRSASATVVSPSLRPSLSVAGPSG